MHRHVRLFSLIDFCSKKIILFLVISIIIISSFDSNISYFKGENAFEPRGNFFLVRKSEWVKGDVSTSLN